MEVAAIIYEPRIKSYCRHVSNNSDYWEDLYQEFCLYVLTNVSKIKKAIEERSINLEAYCIGIIFNMWYSYSGDLHKTTRRSEKKYLFANFADRGLEINDHSLLYADTDIESQSDEAQTQLNKLLRSNNQKIKKQAAIFNEFVNGKNRLEISKEKSINYALVHKAVKETAQTIKYTMTKNEIKSRLLAEGISSSYSGKQKTFYTSKKPSPDLEKSIIRAGFKSQTK